MIRNKNSPAIESIEEEEKQDGPESVQFVEYTLGDIPDSGRTGRTDSRNQMNTPKGYLSGRKDKSPLGIRSNASSNEDIMDLKAALGGNLSDRSGNIVDQPIFSDEGSDDSFTEEQIDEEMWNKIDSNKASLQLLRTLTQKMKGGDETDLAIQKVLHNLVQHVLVDFDPNNTDYSNLTPTQRLEKRNQQLIYELATCLPFVKLTAGKYLIGSEVRQIAIKGRGVLVRTGGGYMYLSEYMLHYAKIECIKLGLVMLKQKKTFQQIVVSLLKKHPNSESAQKDFIKKCPDGIDKQFNDLVAEVRAVDLELQKKKSKNNSMNKSLNKSLKSKTSLISPSQKQKMSMKHGMTLDSRNNKISPLSDMLKSDHVFDHSQTMPANLSPI